MVKKMHYLAREHVSALSNRKVGIGICGEYGRSLKNFTNDKLKVTCKNCIKRLWIATSSTDETSHYK